MKRTVRVTVDDNMLEAMSIEAKSRIMKSEEAAMKDISVALMSAVVMIAETGGSTGNMYQGDFFMAVESVPTEEKADVHNN